MPDNASLVKNKYAAVCCNKENILVTKLVREELSSVATALYDVHKDVASCTQNFINWRTAQKTLGEIWNVCI